LLQLLKADGADRTRANDAGTDKLRNREPNGVPSMKRVPRGVARKLKRGVSR
jgi:hypothetical protein